MRRSTYARFPRWLRLGYWLAWLYWPEFRSPVRFRSWAWPDALKRARVIDRLELHERGTL